MDKFILDCLATIGLCLILKYGTILNLFRDYICRLAFFKALFDCSLCLGVYTGALIAYASDYDDISILKFSLASSGICWLADHIILLLKEKIWPD